MRWAPLGAFLKGITYERAQLLCIHTRICARELGKGRFIHEQTFPPLLRRLMLGIGASCGDPEICNTLGNGRCVHLAHQAPDVLHLAPAGLEAADALRRGNRVGETLRQCQLAKLLRRELDELLAERLQRVHLLLALRFADLRLVGLVFHDAADQFGADIIATSPPLELPPHAGSRI